MTVRISAALPLALLTGSLISGCGSSSTEAPDGQAPGPDAGKDVAVGESDATPDSALSDVAAYGDGPTSDGSSLPVDGDSRIDAGRADARVMSLPDGRVLEVVGRCPGVEPLWPSDGGYPGSRCPASFGEAMLLTATDAGSPYRWAEPILGRCSEGTWFFAFDPMGGLDCFYRSDSQQLFAAQMESDTLHECPNSNLVSFVTRVYGESVQCTNYIFITPDGGSGLTPPSVDAAVDADSGK